MNKQKPQNMSATTKKWSKSLPTTHFFHCFLVFEAYHSTRTSLGFKEDKCKMITTDSRKKLLLRSCHFRSLASNSFRFTWRLWQNCHQIPKGADAYIAPTLTRSLNLILLILPQNLCKCFFDLIISKTWVGLSKILFAYRHLYRESSNLKLLAIHTSS